MTTNQIYMNENRHKGTKVTKLIPVNLNFLCALCVFVAQNEVLVT